MNNRKTNHKTSTKMNMKKRTILALSTMLVASSLLTSCSDAKVEQTETVTENTTEATPIEETTPTEIEESTIDSVEAPVEETVVTPMKKTESASKEEVKQVEKNVEAKTEKVKEAAAGTPKMTFEQTEFEFGDITQGDKVSHTFTFKNTGTAPLLITNARAACGCTVPEWPKEPIAPGKSGKIDVEFNSRGKSGSQNKAVTITTNIVDQPQQIVYMKGNITVPKPETTPTNN